MISLEDCIAMCGLTQAEVSAIAEHEHIPEIAASTVGRYLLARPGGPENVRRMIIDDIRAAFDQGRASHAADLVLALHHLHVQFPQLAAE